MCKDGRSGATFFYIAVVDISTHIFALRVFGDDFIFSFTEKAEFCCKLSVLRFTFEKLRKWYFILFNLEEDMNHKLESNLSCCRTMLFAILVYSPFELNSRKSLHIFYFLIRLRGIFYVKRSL